MPNENIQTLLIAFFPFLLVLAEVRDVIVIGGGSFSIAWIARQLYLSFVKRREEKEKRREEKEKRREEQEEHRLRMAILRKQLGEDDDSTPQPEA